MKVEESINVTFDESPPATKLSPLVDDDVGEEEAIRKNTKIINTNNEEDESIEVDEIINIKESKNHPLDQVIGNLNQRTLRSQAQNHSNFFCFISTIEPKNVNEALKDESWVVAMQEELNQFVANDVWELVPLPISQSVIGTKWVFRNKLDENGIVSRNKARLVSQGYNQQEGIDYDETYALVARLESIRILLAIAYENDFKLYQMDMKSAFINGFINEEVYVAQPLGFIDFQKPNYVYKLKKALYGLKQAPKAWYDRLKLFLMKHEYSMGMVDNTLFTKKSKSHLIIVQIYVDDITFGSTSQNLCDDFAKIMHDEFKMSMMGELNFFLGLQIKQMEDEIFFNQSKYIKEMLKKFGLEDSKPTKTPMSTEIKLTKDDEADSVDSSKYRGMIGSLLYLTASRPDIMFSVCLCARFQENPKTTHLEAVKRIFRYIRGTSHLGLWYPKGTRIETVVYADSDHAGDYIDRKSTSGICTFMGCCLTSWFAKKQTALAISTTEAEYVFTGKAFQQALWMKQALIDYRIRLDDVLTAKQLAARRNQEKVKSILLLAIPDEYLLKFHNVIDAKSLWEAIKSRFGWIVFWSLDKAYDRFQKLISQLEVHGAPISKEDVRKFIRRQLRNMDFKEKLTCFTYKSKIEVANNCTRKRQFARHWWLQDGLGGYDWSKDFEIESVNYALNVISSSRTRQCFLLKMCNKNVLNNVLNLLKLFKRIMIVKEKKHSRARLEIQGYELALESLESRILVHEKNELAWGKQSKANTQKPKTVYESVNRDKVIIEDWNSDDEDNVSEVQTVNPLLLSPHKVANAGESSFVYLGGQIPINASTLSNADLPTDPNMTFTGLPKGQILRDQIYAVQQEERSKRLLQYNKLCNARGTATVQTTEGLVLVDLTIWEKGGVHQPLGFVDPAHPNKVYKERSNDFIGELTFFLGLQVKQQPDGIFISQDKYVADILKKFNFWSIRTATTPIESNKPLVKDEDGEDVDVTMLIGQ
ncbi:retrovirus-related pol polyprotein from transposon TNT 1-94 [Tanacetum coccineum]